MLWGSLPLSSWRADRVEGNTNLINDVFGIKCNIAVDNLRSRVDSILMILVERPQVALTVTIALCLSILHTDRNVTSSASLQWNLYQHDPTAMSANGGTTPNEYWRRVLVCPFHPPLCILLVFYPSFACF